MRHKTTAPPPESMKCRRCKREFPFNTFPFRRDGQWGRRRECRECHLSRIARWNRDRKGQRIRKINRAVEARKTADQVYSFVGKVIRQFGTVDNFWRAWHAHFEIASPKDKSKAYAALGRLVVYTERRRNSDERANPSGA